MSRALRFSEEWFRRALWLIALVFAAFLIGLGGLIVGDLPRVEREPTLAQFLPQPEAAQEQAALRRARAQQQARDDVIARQQLIVQAAGQQAGNAADTFANWLQTRTATARPEQDAELLRRTRELDVLKAQERSAEAELERLQQAALDTRQALQRSERRLLDLEQQAAQRLEQARRAVELRVFLYRLLLTLPLLVMAAWLFARKRQSAHWPFVWGFIFFALFAFFVELVPYLPSYGGYVRYLVGVVLTWLAGHYAIAGMRRYLARQKALETLPDAERRQGLGYDVAHMRLAKGICPGCERAVDLRDASRNYCMHCGLCLFDHCASCDTRKNAFARHCHACGVASAGQGSA